MHLIEYLFIHIEICQYLGYLYQGSSWRRSPYYLIQQVPIIIMQQVLAPQKNADEMQWYSTGEN